MVSVQEAASDAIDERKYRDTNCPWSAVWQALHLEDIKRRWQPTVTASAFNAVSV